MMEAEVGVMCVEDGEGGYKSRNTGGLLEAEESKKNGFFP